MAGLPEGKIPWDLIAERIGGVLPDSVVLGPGPGEDAALVEIGGELWAVACDPITFSASDAGRLSVIVNANDVAVMGARPTFFLAAVLVAPEEASHQQIAVLLDQIRSTCEGLGVGLIGGHSEVTPGLRNSIVVGTMLGRVEGRAITSSGLRPGDSIGITKWAGLEGTAILMAEHGDRLRSLDGATAFRQLDRMFSGDWLSVVPEAGIAAANPEVSALHDVTEGGVGEALFELGRAAGLALEVDPEQIPVLPETRTICAELSIDPHGLLGSGALLVGCREPGRAALAAAYSEHEIPFAWIGRAVASDAAGRAPAVPRFPRDQILETQLLDGIEAVLFDMDGTLVESSYDWQAIRRELGVTQPSIIDALNRLDGEERREKWQRLEEIERLATEQAELKPAAQSLLRLLSEHGLRTALVTNNGGRNTARLVERFGLDFDLVLTRDSGLWKPSGAPLAEAMRRLGVAPERCLKIGDSRYDVLAAREAGCGRILLVHGELAPADLELAQSVDKSFPDLESLWRYLRVLL